MRLWFYFVLSLLYVKFADKQKRVLIQHEADEVGIRMMANAGYDMREALRLAKARDVLGTCSHQAQSQMVQLQRLPQSHGCGTNFP